MEEFPPNSKKVKAREREPVQRVTSTSAVRRKKPLGKQFSRTFFSGNARTAWDYSITNVMIPMIQDTFIEFVQSGIERLIRGEHRSRRPGQSYYGHVNYAGYRQQRQPQDDRPPMPRMLPRAAKTRQIFDEIIIPSRQEAEEVIDRLYDLISKYESATVADLYELTGLNSSHVDHTWGWTSLRGASVGRVRGGGYLLDLPEPEYLQ
jgi:hypothetical protein